MELWRKARNLHVERNDLYRRLDALIAAGRGEQDPERVEVECRIAEIDRELYGLGLLAVEAAQA